MQEPSPLNDSQLSILAQAREARRKLRFGGLIALGNGVGLGLCAVLSLGSGLLELSLSPVGLALGALAWNEQRGRRLLLDADARAPRRLAMNQILLFIVVLIYCAHAAYTAWTGPNLLDAVLKDNRELSEALGEAVASAGTSADELSQWSRAAALLVYGAIVLGSLVVQGLTAWYYSSLRAAVEALAAAAPWARALA
jgi:hypothetical protein